MAKQLIIDLDEMSAELLASTVDEINNALNEHWTAETLAASYLAHLLMDDVDSHTRH